MENPFRRLRIGLVAFSAVLVAGTIGYLVLGFGLLDAVYQTVITVTTVGFNVGRSLDTADKVFTIVLILLGVGTALYTFSTALELLIEGHMRDLVRRRRMERDISRLSGHVIICGWGRVGREVARFLSSFKSALVVVDRNPERLADLPHPVVQGDGTDDETLLRAGIERAATLVAALDTDGDNLYVTLAGRTMRPDIQIIARARNESSGPKLLRAGADRVVNPQKLGGDRIASFVVQPHVADFVDVVMHDRTFEFRLEECALAAGSPLVGATLSSARLRERTGALVLAIRRLDGEFVSISPDIVLEPGDVLISVGTAHQLADLAQIALSATGEPSR